MNKNKTRTISTRLSEEQLAKVANFAKLGNLSQSKALAYLVEMALSAVDYALTKADEVLDDEEKVVTL